MQLDPLQYLLQFGHNNLPKIKVRCDTSSQVCETLRYLKRNSQNWIVSDLSDKIRTLHTELCLDKTCDALTVMSRAGLFLSWFNSYTRPIIWTT